MTPDFCQRFRQRRPVLATSLVRLAKIRGRCRLRFRPLCVIAGQTYGRFQHRQRGRIPTSDFGNEGIYLPRPVWVWQESALVAVLRGKISGSLPIAIRRGYHGDLGVGKNGASLPISDKGLFSDGFGFQRERRDVSLKCLVAFIDKRALQWLAMSPFVKGRA